MRVTNLMAELAVDDHEAALEWFAGLIGRPADTRPMAGLAEWHFPGTGGLQVFHDPERAGRGLLTLTVGGLATQLAELAALGIEPTSVGEATSLGVPFATVTDPDGNAITLVEQSG